jgi:hypothetical protein
VTDAHTQDARLTEILRRTRFVLLDFDGPVCDVFAGYPATDTADTLRALLATELPDLPADVATTRDPLHIVHRSPTSRPA